MTTRMERKLGDLLVKDGLISQDQLADALERQRESKLSLGALLIEVGAASEFDMQASLSRQLNVPFIILSQYEIGEEVLQSIPREIVSKYNVVPVDLAGDTLTVALADPNDILIVDELRLLTKRQIVPVISFETDIQEAITRYYATDTDDSSEVLNDVLKGINEQDMEIVSQDLDDDRELSADVNDAPVIRLVNAVISEALKDNASDIHIEPYEKKLRLRYRVDGVLQERQSPPKKLQNSIISRIKILSNMDIAERRLPRDGRFSVKYSGEKVDFRVNSVPTASGEKIVIRILRKTNLMELSELGMEPEAYTIFDAEIHKPWGMILVSGPTGSGKSTTLYSALTTINTPEKNISTIEEPVEYQIMGINQVQARQDIGLTFAEGLRAFLRQDPDIIMVGEIRDLETVEVSVKAALTGHLVFSTIHTNDAPSTVGRLTNMGVEPFLISSALNMVVAQRLVRRICKKCKTEFEPPPEPLTKIGLAADEVVYHGVGCSECREIGYLGRLALYEVMAIAESLRQAIVDGVPSAALKQIALKNGLMSLRATGVRKIRQGITTIEEVLAATVADAD